MAITFQDVFKSGFLEKANAVSLFDMVLTMALAFGIGVFIYFIYRRCCTGVLHSVSFGVTLIGLTMVTALVILAVTSNIVLSLGMVGALSIVRFRTAIKEPSDIVFLFWAIAAGIVLAAGLIPLAIFASLLIGLVLLVFSRDRGQDGPYILMIHCADTEAENRCREFVGQNVKKLALKSKTVSSGCIELHYEVRLKDDSTDFVNALAQLPGVSYTVMVSYNGDYMN